MCKNLFFGSLLVLTIGDVDASGQHESAVEMLTAASKPSWSNSSKSLLWAKGQLASFERQITIHPRASLRELRMAIEKLSRLDAQTVLSNRRHFADLQALEALEGDFLYYISRHLLHSKASTEELKGVLKELESIGAPAEDRLWIYERLQDDSKYLKSLREIWELHERSPDQLKRPLPSPPVFPRMSKYDLSSCHEVSTVIDLAMKQVWRPKPEELETLLLKLVRRYETLGSEKVALDVMKLAPRGLKFQRLEKERLRLEKKVSQQGDWLKQSGDLY